MAAGALQFEPVLRLDVPAGEHFVYILVLQRGFQTVINGAPSSDGPVLNHLDAVVVRKYLDRMSGALEKQLGPLGKRFRAMFCDSLELAGDNWCADMLEQFQARRHYSLEPYLPFILFRPGGMNAVAVEGGDGAELGEAAQLMVRRVRYDFLTLLMELFSERFTGTFHAWCHEHGVHSRAQAYGPPAHPLESSMQVDIPECETWIMPRLEGTATINKMVSSGAHLSGKKLVSCEELTNTEMVFNATLGTVKITSDRSLLTGVTHAVVHGFNYSPPQAGFPGWVRYGTYFSEQNPWWPQVRVGPTTAPAWPGCLPVAIRGPRWRCCVRLQTFGWSAACSGIPSPG